MRRVPLSRLRSIGTVTAVVATAVVVPAVLVAPASAVTTTGYAVTGTVAVGSSPFGVAVDPSTRTLYVVNSGSRTVSVVDGVTHTVTATVAVGTNPARVAVDPSTRTVYVTNTGANSVSVINGTTNTVTATVSVGNSPVGVAVDPSTHTVYVTNSSSGTVSVIDGTTNTTTATLAVGQGPGGPAVDASTHTAYVVNSTASSVSVIKGSTVTATIAVGGGSTTAAVDPSTHTVYVANRTAGTVTTIDGLTNAVTGTIAVGASPNLVAVDPSTHTLYVGSFTGARSVSVIDAGGVTAGVPVAANPSGLVVDATTHTLFAAMSGANAVAEINQGVPAVAGVSPASGPLFGGDPVTITGANFTGATSVRFGSSAVSFTVDSATQITASSPARPAGPVDVTVTGPSGTSGVTADDRYTVLPAPTTAGPISYTVTGTTTVGAGANGVGVDPSTHTVYVANSGGNSVSVIDGTTNAVRTTVTVGRNPSQVAVDPLTHTVYVTNSGGDSVSVIDGTTNTVKATVTVGVRPLGVAVDPSARTVYVANSGATTVSVVDGRSNTVTRTVTLAASPSGVGVDPSTHTAYVAVPTTGSLAVITGVSGAVTTLALTGSPSVVAVDPTTHAVYVVTDAGGGSVSVVDGPTGAVTGTFAAGGPIAVDPATHTVYVSGGGTTTTVQAVDGANPTATVAIGQVPTGIAVDPTTHTVYAAAASRLSSVNPGPPVVEGVSPASGLVTGGEPVTIVGANLTGVTSVKFGDRTVPFRIDSARRITVPGFAAAVGQVDVVVTGRGGTSPVTAADRYSVLGGYRRTAGVAAGGTSAGVAVDEVSHSAYVTNERGNSVSVIDGTTRAVTATIGVGGSPSGVAVDPSTHTVYVVNSTGNSVSVIDGPTNTVTAVVPVGASPSGVAVDPSTRRVFVANRSAGTVSVIDGRTNAVITSVTVGGHPSGVGVDPSTHTVYVGGAAVSVIDGLTNTVTATVGVATAGTAFDVAVDPSAHTVYVAGSADGVSVISGATNTVSATVTTPGGASGVAVDSATHTVYVTTVSSLQSVSVINGLTVTGGADFNPVGGGGFAVAVDSATHTVFVNGSGRLWLVDAGDTPTLTAVSPGSGSVSGGQTVTVTGTNLRYATAVKFGSVAASSFTADSDTQITAVTPVGGSGTVDVTVTTPWGTTATSAGGRYTSTSASPGITTTPSSGTAAGGVVSEAATLTGGSAATGTVTFGLFGPGDDSCSGPAVTTRDVAVSGAAAASGDVTVTRAGTYRWTASYSGDGNNRAVSSGCGDATVVTAGSLDHIALSPDTASVVAGAAQDYTAEGFDAYGNSRGDVTADTTFAIDGGGTCVDAVCTPSTAAGSATVTGTDGSATDTATLEVTAAALDHIVIAPGTASIAAGGSQTYTAEGFDAYGNSRGDITDDTTFAVSGGSCTGPSCTSTAAGAHTVTGTDGELSDTAVLTVTTAALDHIVVAPGTASVTAGGSQTYAAEGFDAYGNSLGDVTADTAFAIDGDGSCDGAVCTPSTTAGTYAVTGTDAAATDTASVTVTAAALDRLVVSPALATVVAGGSEAFGVEGFDAYGNSRGDVTGDTTFTVDGGGTCDGAVCTPATTVGRYTVTASSGGESASVTVRVTPAAFDHLNIAPGSTTIVAGAAREFAVSAYDRYGNFRAKVAAALSITGGGSCSGTVCTPSTTVGTYAVTGGFGGKSATATVKVEADGVDHLVVTPAVATVTAGGAGTFVVTAADRYGNSRGKVAASLSIGGGGTCDGLSCTPPTTVGRYDVTASFGGMSASATVRVTPAAFDRINIAPGSTTIAAGGAQAYLVSGYDRFGNFRSKVAASLSIDGGGTCDGLTCTPPARKGRFAVTASFGGKSAVATLRVTEPAGRTSNPGW